MKRVLFVCLGNICRSPLAKAIFNHKINQKGLTHFFEGDACGTSNYHIGSSPDPRTIRNSIKNGVAISHAARQLTQNDLQDFDLVIAMDRSNYQNIIRLTDSVSLKQKVKLMREFDPIKSGEVPDPYYGDDKDFQEVFDILERSIENMITSISSSN